jgi:ATP-dependent RNA helicase DeaD
MTTEFSQLGLQPQLVQAVSDLGYVTPTPIQAEIIPLMLAGHDVIGQAQTGTGKTAAFMLPILQNLEQDQQKIQALVIAPTRELSVQVAKTVNEFGKYLNVRVLAVYGGQPYSPQINRLRQGVDIVAGTPGRLKDLINKKVLDLSYVKSIVLDEADEMLSMGFIEDIEEILSAIPSEHHTALFSATISPRISGIAKKYMNSPQSISIKSEHLIVDTIEHRYYVVNREDKTAALTRIVEMENITRAMIFARTRSNTTDLANDLIARGFPAEALNGDLNQQTREQVLNRFRHNQINILVATDVAARGLDIDDISHVFNYDLPEDPELYVHRVGRTGRAGKTGIAVSLITARERWHLGRIEGFTKQPVTRMQIPTVEAIEKHRESQLLKEMMSWLERGNCEKESHLVARLIEMGHDPLQIAAISIKMARGEDTRRPVAPMSEVKEVQAAKAKRAIKPGNKMRDRRRTNTSHEKGMVRMTINAGRAHGVRPNDVVGTIAYHADFPGNVIGHISILDNQTLVDVPQRYVAQILAKAGKYRIGKSVVKLDLA